MSTSPHRRNETGIRVVAVIVLIAVVLVAAPILVALIF
jgi:hypothetical protein